MIRSSERSRGSYRSFAVLSASPIVLVRPTTRGLEFMECTACGRIWKQDRGLIDLGCEPETKLRRTHDKGKGVGQLLNSFNLKVICSLTRLGWSRTVVGSDFHLVCSLNMLDCS